MEIDAARPRTWHIQRPALAWAGIGMLAAALLVEALLARRWLDLPVSPAAVAVALAAVALGLIAVALAARLLSCLTLRYVLDNNTLTIVRGMARWVIPLAAIGRVYMGEPRAVLRRGEVLPGFMLGRGYVKDEGAALFFSTVPAAKAVVVQTDACFYILSPTRSDEFLLALEQRRTQAGAAQAAEPGRGPLVFLRHPLSLVLTALAVLTDAALGAYVAWWYPALPNLPVHFTAAGVPDRWATPAAHLWLPQIGAILIVINVLLALLPPLRRPMTTFVLLGSAVLAQVLLLVAFQRLLP